MIIISYRIHSILSQMVGPVEWEVTRQTRALFWLRRTVLHRTGLGCLIPFPAGVGGESVSQTVRPCSIKYIIVELSLGYIQHILSLHYHGSTATHHILLHLELEWRHSNWPQRQTPSSQYASSSMWPTPASETKEKISHYVTEYLLITIM